jgi:hypothetical protein
MFLRRLISLALAALLPAAPAAFAAAEKIRSHFDSDAPMRAPGFFDFAVLGNPGPAQWKVLADFNPPSAPNQVTQTVMDRPADSVAAALRRNVQLRDGKVSVGMRNGMGQGGLVIRIAGEKDFLLLLVNLESGEARLSSYAGGKPVELARGRVKADRQWGTLSVEASGPRVLAHWDGKALFEASDPRPVSGRLGIATAGPGAVAFDELIIEPAPNP